VELCEIVVNAEELEEEQVEEIDAPERSKPVSTAAGVGTLPNPIKDKTYDKKCLGNLTTVKD
jgi:hypothetical protein